MAGHSLHGTDYPLKEQHMPAPQNGNTDVRGYVLPDGRICALGDDTPANQGNPYVLGCITNHGLPVLTEVLFDVAQFAAPATGLYATNVRRA